LAYLFICPGMTPIITPAGKLYVARETGGGSGGGKMGKLAIQKSEQFWFALAPAAFV
jgi:hypothetical protein